MSSRQRVAVVTGGGGGIGAAIAEELGRDGWFVVTVDPLVTLDGSERLQEPEETTAGRIVAAGGSARASSVSVTDGEAVRGLFNELVEEQGGLDAVVNVAGITRQTGFAHGAEQDWLAVLAVHLGGYLNVLDAALPLMAAAGHGRILGVTSGSGWRAADAGAYSCAKRAVAAITRLYARGLLPIVTATEILSDRGGAVSLYQSFREFLIGLGIDKPRVKIMPVFALGRLERDGDAILTAEALQGFDRATLQCADARVVAAGGVYACPILAGLPGARLSTGSLVDSFRPARLYHSACSTCHQTGMSCRNG